MVDTPKTLVGTLVTIGAALIVLLFLFTTNLYALLFGAAIVAVVLYVLYLIGIGLHQRALRYLSGQRGGGR